MDTDKEIIVIYDAQCSFCNWCRRFVEQRDVHKKMIFRGFDDKKAAALLRTQTVQARVNINDPDTIVVFDQKRRPHYKFDACLTIGSHLTVPYRALSALFQLLPMRLGDALYDRVSRHRAFLCKIIQCIDKNDRSLMAK